MLWLWHRPAAAVPIQPLACELPYAEGVALKRQKKKNKPKQILYFLIFEDSEIMVEEEKRRSRDTR